MSDTYNSKLISDLYQSKDNKEIENLLEEMGEIGDPHFTYPIYDKYKQNEAYAIYQLR